MNANCGYLGKKIAWREALDAKWLILGIVRKEEGEQVLIVSEHNSTDRALMPFGLFQDALEAGILTEVAA
ncbi:hypothetical protein [Synechococcus sp. PCC 7336]|uniref:hypothetical protein n=1 Tax=Synechococcus sp. PCC 7336 TaxID=195250 RepID=UPI000349AF13|nr:hypothetical protein [Synechococcus sp. PCC 7336]